MKNYVLDSYAVLMYFQDETGANKVEELFRQASQGTAVMLISTINLGEIAYITQRKAGLEGKIKLLHAIDLLPITVVDADRSLALKAAAIKARHAISYADCFALALAQINEGTVVTGDPEYKKIEKLVPIHWLPEKPRGK